MPPRPEQEREDSDLEDVFVESGAVKDMEAALEKARDLTAMLASGLPSKVRPRTPPSTTLQLVAVIVIVCSRECVVSADF